MQECALYGQLFDLSAPDGLRDGRYEFQLRGLAVVSGIEEASGVRKGKLVDELSEVIDVNERKVVASAAVVSQRLLLLEGLLEEREEGFFSHAVDDAGVDDAAGDGRVEVVYPKRQVLQLLNYAIQRSPLQVILPLEKKIGVPVSPLKNRGDDYHPFRGCA